MNFLQADMIGQNLTILRAFTYASVVDNPRNIEHFLDIHKGYISYDKYEQKEKYVLKIIIRLNKRQLRYQVGYEYIYKTV